ncbi:MAG: tetratricopeptide repeat protein [Pirellulales bacterium]
MSISVSASELKVPQAESGRTFHWLASLGLVLLTGLAFLNGLSAPFYLDDQQLLERNPAIRTLKGAVSIPTPRRVGMLSFALNYQVHRLSPAGYRVVNIAIHATAGLLLFGLVRRSLLLPDDSRDAVAGASTGSTLASHSLVLASVAAAVWLVHPLQTGSVTYVIQRFESLMGMLYLATLYCLLRGATTTSESAVVRWAWYGAGLLAAFLGAETKEVMVTVPVVALAYDRIFLARDWRSLVRLRGAWHALLWLIAGWILWQTRAAIAGEQTVSAGLGTKGMTAWTYLSSQAGVLLHYLKLSFWPQQLCLDYQWPIAQSPWDIYPQGAVIVLLLVLTVVALFRAPRLGFLGFAFFTILAPTSSVLPIADLAFEHRMYLPLACVVPLTVVGFTSLVQSLLPDPAARRRVLVSFAGVVLVLLIGRTVARNRDYVDPIRMWNSVLAVTPRSYRAHNQLGLQYEKRGDLARAEHHFLETLRIRPNAWWVDIGLGNLRIRQDRWEDAEQHFQNALRHPAATSLACANLARLRELQERWREAADLYQRAVDKDPSFLDAWQALAAVQLRLGDTQSAASAYESILARDPRSAKAREGLSKLRTR